MEGKARSGGEGVGGGGGGGNPNVHSNIGGRDHVKTVLDEEGLQPVDEPSIIYAVV
jgi:hypothetical protein